MGYAYMHMYSLKQLRSDPRLEATHPVRAEANLWPRQILEALNRLNHWVSLPPEIWALNHGAKISSRLVPSSLYESEGLRAWESPCQQLVQHSVLGQVSLSKGKCLSPTESQTLGGKMALLLLFFSFLLQLLCGGIHRSLIICQALLKHYLIWVSIILLFKSGFKYKETVRRKWIYLSQVFQWRNGWAEIWTRAIRLGVPALKFTLSHGLFWSVYCGVTRGKPGPPDSVWIAFEKQRKGVLLPSCS